ncbi:MAG: 3-hydroxyacyl-CoA dehydrogenase [Geminicoccaceae bacterium]|nr:3-hydroxyacyl-CoA dehydrogenase [Geminicoccaceae bacterium]
MVGKVAVIGAGVMGAGIAAQVANAGVEVHLLDIVPEGAKDRDALAKRAVARLLKTDPAPFMTKRAARRVVPGNIEDHLERLRDCDWVVEVVVERADVKRALYARLLPHLKPDAVLSSNTSTLPLAVLKKGMDEDLRRRFLITHFFNPPRYMRLVEIVADDETDPRARDAVAAFCDRALGKTPIPSNDTPGFIANRVGVYWMQAAIGHALRLGLDVEEADAVMGRPFGFPKTGVFGLIDLVGLDLVPYVDASLARALPESDPYHAERAPFPLLLKLVEEGYTGRKGKGGFYRLNREGGDRLKETVDLALGTYRPARKAVLASVDAAKAGGAAALLKAGDRGGAYARAVIARTLAYAIGLAGEVSDDVADIDAAMRLGYNWKKGPFALADSLGLANLKAMLGTEGVAVPAFLDRAIEAGGFYREEDGRLRRLALDGGYVPVERPDGVLLLEDVKRRSDPLAKNASSAVWDLGDGVLCFEIRSKMGTIDAEVLGLMGALPGLVAETGARGVVVYDDGGAFSAGANLGLALFAANVGAWDQIEALVEGGQRAYSALRYAPFPVVAAPSGLALGGGCEILLAADAVQAHAETYAGLVEVGVGVVPGWGGCARLLARYAADPMRPKGPVAPVAAAFEQIGMAKVARSAFEAMEMGLLAPGDGITFNRDRLLADAKAKALTLAGGYAPPEPATLRLPGPTGRAALGLALADLDKKGQLTAHDRAVTTELAGVLTGGDGADWTAPVSEDDVMALERAAFMRLVRTEGTLERIGHMLETGKPLRN